MSQTIDNQTLFEMELVMFSLHEKLGSKNAHTLPQIQKEYVSMYAVCVYVYVYMCVHVHVHMEARN